MGKRTREVMMRTWKEEKDKDLNQKYKELEQHKYWDSTCKRSSPTFGFISMSPRKLMSCLQTEHATLLASSEEEDELSSLEVCNECLDCISNGESDHEEARSVAASTTYVGGDIFCNEMNADATEKCRDEEIDGEFNKGMGENLITCANVKKTETIRTVVSVRWVICMLVLVLVSIGIAIGVRDILSVCNAWFLPDDDLNVVFLPPT